MKVRKINPSPFCLLSKITSSRCWMSANCTLKKPWQNSMTPTRCPTACGRHITKWIWPWNSVIVRAHSKAMKSDWSICSNFMKK